MMRSAVHATGDDQSEEARSHVEQGSAVAYDATNIQRRWRTDFLRDYIPARVDWIGWVFQTPFIDCIQHNQDRPETVPMDIIDDAQLLHPFPPQTSERRVSFRYSNECVWMGQYRAALESEHSISIEKRAQKRSNKDREVGITPKPVQLFINPNYFINQCVNSRSQGDRYIVRHLDLMH